MKTLVIWLQRLTIAIPLVAMFGIPLVFCLAVLADIIANNEILHKYDAKFQKFLHPRDTSKIHSFKHVMRSPGNGDNCFYFVGELRQTASSQTKIEAFYSEFDFVGEFSVKFANNGEFSQRIPYGFDDISRFPIEYSLNTEQNLYMIYWLIPDYLTPYRHTFFDLRCQ